MSVVMSVTATAVDSLTQCQSPAGSRDLWSAFKDESNGKAHQD